MSDKRFAIDCDLEELEEENMKLREKVEEQQTTINELQSIINLLDAFNLI